MAQRIRLQWPSVAPQSGPTLRPEEPYATANLLKKDPLPASDAEELLEATTFGDHPTGMIHR